MDTQNEPEQQPTIAGRALRALRTTRAPAEPTAPPPDGEDEAPEPTEPAADIVPVDLVKAAADDAIVDEVADHEAPDDAAAGSRRNGLLLASVMVVVAALAFAVIGLVVYLKGTASAAADAAKARDDALVAARIDIATLNTLDYRSAKAGLQKWLAVSTGDLHDQITQQEASVVSGIAKAKMTTTGRVIAAAIADLNSARNSAIVIASLDTVKTPAGGKSAVERNRYRATMQLVDGVWKIADLSLVQVGLS